MKKNSQPSVSINYSCPRKLIFIFNTDYLKLTFFQHLDPWILYVCVYIHTCIMCVCVYFLLFVIFSL